MAANRLQRFFGDRKVKSNYFACGFLGSETSYF